MNGSPPSATVRTAIRRRRGGGGGKEEVIEQRVRTAREAWCMYCTCMMVEQCDFLEAICHWCAKPVLS